MPRPGQKSITRTPVGRAIRRAEMWCRALFARRGVDDELRREIAFHIELETEQLMQTGLARAEARRRALVAFGGIDRYSEDARDERGTRFLQDIGQDVRMAVRSIRLRPPFAIVVALTLAIGVGATTAVFSWANALLIRPVAGIRNQRELFTVVYEREPGQPTGISWANFVDLKSGNSAIASLAGHQWANLQIGGITGPPTTVISEFVMGDYFSTLSVRPMRGRLFTIAEVTPPEEQRVVVVSERFWKNSLGSDTNFGSRKIIVNGLTFTVIGVVADGFLGTELSRSADLWLPLPTYVATLHRSGYSVLDRSVGLVIELVGRMNSGVSLSATQAQIRQRMAGLVLKYPSANEIYSESLAQVGSFEGIDNRQRIAVAGTMKILFGIVAIVLLIACANVANLLLFRSVRRRSEFSVRRALGASVSRLLRQHIVEGVLLSLLGGIAGLLIAFVLVKLFSANVFPGFVSGTVFNVDWRVLLFALATCLVTGAMFGTIPAMVAIRLDPVVHLKLGARTGTSAAARLRGVLSVLQLSASVSLLVPALLMSRTLINLSSINIGFDSSHVQLFRLDPAAQGYSASQARVFRQELLRRVESQPGIASASIASQHPFAGSYNIEDLKAETSTSNSWDFTAKYFAVSPRYFETLGMRFVEGRAFRPDDNDAAPVAVINQTLAHQLFGDSVAVGQRFVTRQYRSTTTLTVVGVVGDVRVADLRMTKPEAVMFSSQSVSDSHDMVLLVRSNRDRADVYAMVRSILNQMNPALPITSTEMLTESIAKRNADSRLFGQLIGLLAAFAAILASIGLYSIIAYSVAARTREIGVCIALGARDSSIVQLVIRQAGVLVLAGLVIGVPSAATVSKLLESRLYGVTRLDPSVYVATAILSVLLGIIASAFPARTAARVSPIEALRHE